ncbi:MAG TPA: hypothetical protein VK636_10435 [Gemmatimonadaceae bacterium]|nr:hypothetical protein [Gemmatimonadaceae bacterium]
MLSLLLCAQLAVATQSIDSTYSSQALRAMIARAAVANRQPPAEFRSYQSRIETEVSLLLRDTLGRENTAEVEQLASTATWTRDERYDLHVIGYRSQSVGVPYSTLSIVRAWTVPSLYGERLSFGAYFTRARTGDTLIAVHPFAADRDQYYQFSGGDTVATLRSGSRSIPIARIHVRPNFHGPTRLGAFDGEIDLDAERGQIVRMRGRFVVVGHEGGIRSTLARAAGIVGVVYAEFVNVQVGDKYWLPAFQRTEFQAAFPMLGQARPIFRIVSTIRDIAVSESGPIANAPDTAVIPRVRVSWAPSDSVNRYDQWQRGIGTQSGAVHSDDFDDLAPDIWRADGPPRFNLFPNATSRIFRFNRVEGLYTGISPSVDFRNVMPGLSVGANAGWAWSEKTTRGGGYVTYSRNKTIYGIRADRSLVSTNDFALPLDNDPGFAALLGSVDNYDYLDRRGAMLSVTRSLGSVDMGLATLQFGLRSDHAEQARLDKGPLGGRTHFSPNRGATDGRYALGSADLELHPNVTGDFVQPGIGAKVHYEVGSGDLDWQRIELGLSARRYFGPISFAAHADGGVVLGASPPPQQLFELGGDQSLPGYSYKQFVGDRAALFRMFGSYRFNIWQHPIHFIRNYFLPGLSPGIGVSAQGGWTELSSNGAALAAQQLSATGVDVPEITHGTRATVGGGITLFSDIVHIGVARPVDRPAPWKFVAGFGATF